MRGRDGLVSAERMLLGTCVVAYFAVRYSQVIVGPVLPLVEADFGVTAGAVGVALTGMWIAYAVVQLPSGIGGDRFGDTRVVLLALAIAAGGAVIMALAPVMVVFALGVILLGVGAGAYYNPATAVIGRAYDGIGRAIGIHRIGGQGAGVIAPLAAGSMALALGWRPIVALGALLGVVAAGLFLVGPPTAGGARPETPLRELLAADGLIAILARPHTRTTIALMTLVEFCGLAAMAFIPGFFVGHHEYSLATANALFAVFFGISAASQPVGGWLSDRVGRDVTLAGLGAAGMAGFGIMILEGGMAVAVLGVALAGSAMSATVVLQARMLDGLDEGAIGRGFGLFRTVYLLLGAAGPAVVGLTADRAGWVPAFALLAVFLGVVCIASLAVARREP